MGSPCSADPSPSKVAAKLSLNLKPSLLTLSPSPNRRARQRPSLRVNQNLKVLIFQLFLSNDQLFSIFAAFGNRFVSIESRAKEARIRFDEVTQPPVPHCIDFFYNDDYESGEDNDRLVNSRLSIGEILKLIDSAESLPEKLQTAKDLLEFLEQHEGFLVNFLMNLRANFDYFSAEAEAESLGISPEPAPKGKDVTNFTPKGDFHAMDCTDMVVGMARGSATRVFDYYTRDRSTPRRDDTFWGGNNDLTAAVGFERDGETTILFRKKLDATSGFSDASIGNEELHVIWAIGQEPENYFHAPRSGLETGDASIPDFYRADELKYHGKKNRGVVRMNFYDEIAQAIGKESGNALG